MNYTREKLQSIINTNGNLKEHKEIVQVLADKVFANEEISLAEEQFVCRIIENLRNVNGKRNLNIYDFNSCKNYLFRNRYLLYFTNLNGHKKVINYEGEISSERKKKDTAYLQKAYEDWSSFIIGRSNGFKLINYVAQETKYQLDELDKYCNNVLIGNNLRKYLKKSLILHSKYIYLLVNEFYQELGKEEVIIEINGEKILIDGYTYIHTMFRHFSEQIKGHQTGKTYHIDENIGFKSIPNFLLKAIKYYKKLPESRKFNYQNLNFTFNNTKYAIWLTPFTKYLKGNKKVKYYRIQTFYPIKNKTVLDKLKEYNVIKTNYGFSYYIKD